ncbi:MAG: HAD family hydrolase [Candidatus Doudnabacteria bacterium]|nr:HAD family hydrolase [Candidatus Doudnabacteria bacterium]
MIKLVAFDWNGTLLADTNASVKAESKVLEHFGFKPTTVKEFQKTYDIPIKKYWIGMKMNEKLFERKADEIHGIFNKHYEPLENSCRSRAGTRVLLKWLKNKNILSIIYSNHPKEHIRKQLHRLGLSYLINEILGRSQNDNSHLHARSKEDKLKKFAAQNKIKPSEIISVGDTIEEIEIGTKLGLRTIALTGGYNSIKRLKAAKPDFLIHNLNEIPKIIQKLQ